tara:strand:- start:161 stop:424 length:264 start_codon:yes stop_codon:yes gene_type:complete
MGRFVAESNLYIEGTEKRIREVLSEYNDNIHKFETKDTKAAGVRARNNLLELYGLAKARRKEILDRSKTLGMYEHPSWEGVDENETV